MRLIERGNGMNRESSFHFLQDGEAPVRNLQGWLRALSKNNGDIPEVFIDGIYGDETREAVRVFQALNGISPTGVVDISTFDAIYSAYLLTLENGETLGYFPDFDSFEGKGSRSEMLLTIFSFYRPCLTRLQ